MDPISILSSIKLGVSAGKSLASLSKEIGNFFDATDNAKKKLQQKGASGKKRERHSNGTIHEIKTGG